MHDPLVLVRLAALATAVGLWASACSGANTGETSSSTDATGGGDSTAGDGTAGACGDGVVQGEEACDGDDLGGNTCAGLDGFTGGTLACSDTCTLDTSSCEADPMAAIVRLNEVTSEDIDDGTYVGGDAIELHNMGGAAADLSGWVISDDETFPEDKTYAFPDGATLGAGEVLVLVQLDEDTGVGDYPFGISGSNPETLTLADAAGTTIDAVSFEGPDAAVSWCRLPDGDGDWQTCSRTFGELNAGGDPVECGNGTVEAGEDCDGADLGDASSCADVDAALEGRLACSDTCTYDTRGCDATPGMGVVLNEMTSSGDDEIELYNAGRDPVDISAWILTDDLADPRDAYDPDADMEELVFPPGTVIDPGDFLVVIQGGADDEHPFGLGAGGDAVTLMTPGLVVVDFVEYGNDAAVDSYCRLPDGPTGEWTAGCTPTFGDPNQR